MNRDHLRRLLYQSLRTVAPESDPAALDPDADLRQELDLDSMDFLRFITALHQALQLEIPEADYRRLSSLREAEQYLDSKVA